ncbi:MAG: cytochrome c biogenesis protein ResB, partial [Deltaproteobacteria bacterium]|nr:cytochrome c biogenesis protein ResB [Deltaproteobacteria bacterium]
YHAGWFRFLLLMLTLNMLACTINRLPTTLRIVFVKEPKFQIKGFRRQEEQVVFDAVQSPDDAIGHFLPVVSKSFAYTRVEQTDQGTCIFAERGRWTRLGFYLVHFSVILLLLGGLVGSMFGFDGYVQIPEGESVDVVRIGNPGIAVPLDFEIRCDDFSVSFYETGQPKEYRSRLSLVENGKAVLTKDIIVNDPLRYKGINIFQSSYGALAPRAITLEANDPKTGSAHPVTVTVGQTVSLPDGGTLAVVDFKTSYPFGNMNLGETVVCRFTPVGAEPVMVILPTRFPGFDKMRKGQYVFTIQQIEHRYYTGLQVTKDPGVWMVYVSFIFLITGCFVTFFMSHQRLCVEVMDIDGAIRTRVSGNANKNRFGMHQKVDRIAKQLKAPAGRR